jgi:ABC-type transporter Mla subunit MlaD
MNDERLHIKVGLIGLPLVLAAVGAVLWLGQRPLRPVVHLAADFDRVGQLQPGGKVMMANMVVGRVKHITFVRTQHQGKMQRRVRVYFYVDKRSAHQIWTNSPAYISSMSLIGERHLELDAPPDQPAKPVKNGVVLQGHNPSRMDRLLRLGYENLVAASDLGDAVEPHWKRLRGRLESVLDEYDTLASYRDRVESLGDRTERAVRSVRQSYRNLQAATDDFRAFDRIGDRLDRFGRRAKAGAKPIARDMERLMDRLDVLRRLIRERIPRATDILRARADSITARFERIRRWMKTVQRAIELGRGTVGAFMQEKELWDDFKVSGKVIRQEIWRTISRPKKTSVKDAPVVP